MFESNFIGAMNLQQRKPRQVVLWGPAEMTFRLAHRVHNPYQLVFNSTYTDPLTAGALLMNLAELKDARLHDSILAFPSKTRQNIDLFMNAIRKRPCTTHYIQARNEYPLIGQKCSLPSFPNHWTDKAWAQSGSLNNSLIPQNLSQRGNRFVESMTHCTGFLEGASNQQCWE